MDTHTHTYFFSNQSYILIKMKSNIFICRRLLFRYFDAPVETITDLANMWPEYDHCCRRRLYSGSILVFSIRVHTLGKWYSVSASTPLSRRYKFAFDCARKWIRWSQIHARMDTCMHMPYLNEVSSIVSRCKQRYSPIVSHWRASRTLA